MVVMVWLRLLWLLWTQARLGETVMIPLVSLVRKEMLLWPRQVGRVVSLVGDQGVLGRRQSSGWWRLQQGQGTPRREGRSRAVRLRVPGWQRQWDVLCWPGKHGGCTQVKLPLKGTRKGDVEAPRLPRRGAKWGAGRVGLQGPTLDLSSPFHAWPPLNTWATEVWSYGGQIRWSQRLLCENQSNASLYTCFSSLSMSNATLTM